MNSQNKVDVLVVGMGMAGLMAAYTAAKNGKKVKLLSTGLGALSIASGCIDILGYVQENGKSKAVQNPFEGFSNLAAKHPYSILGRDVVEKSIIAVQELFKEYHADFIFKPEQNTLVPTIIGTLKPTYIYPASSDSTPLFAAKRVLVTSVDAIRDCHPHLIVKQLQCYPALKHVEFTTATIASDFGLTHRAMGPLDIARFVDSTKGFGWLNNALAPLAKNVDAILLPPILGTCFAKNQHSIWQTLQENHKCALIEMLSLPPGVGGNRLQSIFMHALRNLGVGMVENATITRAEINDGHCTALISHGEGVEHRHTADAYIVATGGLLGGGISTSPGKAHESIFGIKLDVPNNSEEWAGDNAFESHAFTQMGVTVNNKLQAISNKKIFADNVYFVGRSLEGYDYAMEKSGNGVAMASGWYAAQNI